MINIDIISLGWIILAAITSAIPVAAVKQFLIKKELMWIIISAISFCVVIYSYVNLLNNKHEISAIYPLIKCFSIAIIVGFGLLIFNEEFTFKKGLGLAFGITSICLLSH
jgi:multidrug transporter EmrE-like cation transporter